MSFIRSKDSALYYEEHGTGETLILLPGLLGTIESHWRRFIPHFAEHFHVIAVDLRGHGRTNNPSGQLHLHTLVADMFALYDSLGIESARVCGYSLGGYIALAFGIQHPGTVESLLLHGTKFYWTPEDVEAALREFDHEKISLKVTAWAEQLQREHSHTNGEDGWKLLLQQAKQFIQTMPVEGLTPGALQHADFPVLVSVGDSDEMVPRTEAERLADALPYGMLNVFPNTRHPMPQVDMKMFLDIADSFFNVTHQQDTK